LSPEVGQGQWAGTSHCPYALAHCHSEGKILSFPTTFVGYAQGKECGVGRQIPLPWSGGICPAFHSPN